MRAHSLGRLCNDERFGGNGATGRGSSGACGRYATTRRMSPDAKLAPARERFVFGTAAKRVHEGRSVSLYISLLQDQNKHTSSSKQELLHCAACPYRAENMTRAALSGEKPRSGTQSRTVFRAAPPISRPVSSGRATLPEKPSSAMLHAAVFTFQVQKLQLFVVLHNCPHASLVTVRALPLPFPKWKLLLLDEKYAGALQLQRQLPLTTPR